MRSYHLFLLGLWMVVLLVRVSAELPNDEEVEWECRDLVPGCSIWASEGECEENEDYMSYHCRFSCELCSGDGEENDEEVRGYYLAYGEDFEYDGDNEFYVGLDPHQDDLLRGSDLGEPQHVYFHDDTRASDIMWMIAKARSYMKYWVPEKIGEGMDTICRNHHGACAYWALRGDCEAKADYMKTRCAPVCGSCYNLTVESRCPLDPNASNAWKPGDLNVMFERLTSEPYLSEYDVKILSSPNSTDGPWVITLDNAVTEEESLRLIELGGLMGYSRSKDVLGQHVDGGPGEFVNPGRTSTNAWCVDMCEEEEVPRRINERLRNLTGIPDANAEPLQLLKYEEGQFYETHHDLIDYQLERQGGHRILTVFIYLNDVEEGGGTMFDELELTVMPKRGRVLIWPSVYNDDPLKKDWRTEHQALKVERGIKYGANAWYHMRDYKTPNAKRCM